MIAFLWKATAGYRLAPWKSPYLRWRIETYSGVPSSRIDRKEFWRFAWQRRAELRRFLRWSGRIRRLAG
jgi:hypothetical protein